MTTMTEISAEAVKQLREQTGAGFMDCKRALQETGGDVDKAVLLLRERGMAAAARKSGREAREGLISSYIHTGGRVGVLIEVNCETDFVARTERFQELVRALAIQVAGLSPRWVDVDQIPAAELAAKQDELAADPAAASKPAEIREKIVDGQLKKWFKEVVLLEQPSVTESKLSVKAVLDEAGTNVTRFARFEVGA